MGVAIAGGPGYLLRIARKKEREGEKYLSFRESLCCETVASSPVSPLQFWGVVCKS